MPELPEVQTVVNDLNKKIKGRVVKDIWTDAPKLFKDHLKPAARFTDKEIPKARRIFNRFKKDLIGEKVLSAERIGKNIIIHLSHSKALLVHQKMTGHLLVGNWEVKRGRVVPLSPKEVVNDPYNGFVHFIITFKDKTQLAFSDMRKFGKAILASKKDILNTPDIKNLGLDALSSKLTLKEFEKIIKKSGPTIKQALLKPQLIAGIGNIYADESLYKAKLHPRQDPKSLTSTEVKRLYLAIRFILKKAVKLRGTSTSDFRDTAGKEGGYTNHRLVYQMQKTKCKYCGTKIEKTVVGGRGTHYCPKCQKAVRLYK